MDASELARLMLDWEQAKKRLDILEVQIQRAVLEIGRTQTVGNVRASFSNGRTTYDYETPVTAAFEAGEIVHEALAVYQAIKTDWRAACKAFGLEPLVASQSSPTVTVKLLED